MSDFFYNRSGFTVTDYTGSTTTLSSYNLSITPLKFKSTSLSYFGERTKITWDFGDGTISDEQEPSHFYRVPGLYRAKVTHYNCDDNGIISEIYKDILIKDFLIDKFSVTSANETLSCASGGLSTPIVITQTVPYTVRRDTINYTVSNTDTPWYYEAEYKYSCLLPHHSLYTTLIIDGKELLIPLLNLNVASDSVYGYVQNGTIVTSPTPVETSILLGFSGTQTVYYRDDTLSGNVILNFSRAIEDQKNTLKNTLTCTVLENKDVDHLSITSNGIDGDSSPTTTFNIGSTKLVNTKIPFVVKVKDVFNNTVKNFNNPIDGNNISISVDNDAAYNYTIGTLQHTITSVNGERCGFRGFVEFTDVTTPLSGVRIKAQIQATNINSTEFGIISGESTPFTVFPKNYYSLIKTNENYDMSNALKSLGTAEPLVDKNMLYDKFFGVILGDSSQDIKGLGKKVYERISNFVNNTTNIKTADISHLISISKMMDMDLSVFDSSLLSYPADIRRLINLISISKPNLLGIKNSFIQDFDNKGEPGSGEFGKNLGSEIDILNYPILPYKNRYIVAYEKFSERYTLLNAFQPLNTNDNINNVPLLTESGEEIVTDPNGEPIVGEGMYIINNYSFSWGWPLVLPVDYTVNDISKYYIFYEFVNNEELKNIGGIIDFDLSSIDQATSYHELYKSGGIFENLLANTLYLSLSLTK